MNSQEYDIIIPSFRQKLDKECQENIFPLNSTIFNGTGYESFSKLINHCVFKSEKEIIIICNDKARPKQEHFQKIINLLKEGYGLVGLYAWGFFGFHKDLFRIVGFMDERFLGGEYEDCDYLRRMGEKNIAVYVSFEIPYIIMPSSWNGNGKQFFLKKWKEEKNICERLLPDEKYEYDLGPISNKNNFMEFKKSHIEKSEDFINIKFKNRNL